MKQHPKLLIARITSITALIKSSVIPICLQRERLKSRCRDVFSRLEDNVRKVGRGQAGERTGLAEWTLGRTCLTEQPSHNALVMKEVFAGQFAHRNFLQEAKLKVTPPDRLCKSARLFPVHRSERTE